MIYKSLAILLLLSGIAVAQMQSEFNYVKTVLYPATVLLYSQGDDGGMKMRCTATAIEANATGYVFVSAAHCACNDNVEKTTVSPEKTFFFVSSDEKESKEFLRAIPIGCGYRHRGDDFALFQVDTKQKFPIVPLGKDPDSMDAVVNIASPLGLGKQVFTGSVSSSILNRPVVDGDINWTGAVLLQMFGVAGGSSGSSVICLSQKAICAFVVGSVAQTTMVAMPVSRLEKLRSGLRNGDYKYWKADPDARDK